MLEFVQNIVVLTFKKALLITFWGFNYLVVKFLKDKLKLSINTNKSGIRRFVHLQVLGLGFVPTYRRGEIGKYLLVVTAKKLKSFKEKLKELTRKTTPMSFSERIEKINAIM